MRFGGLADEAHAGFVRRAAAFLMIATEACGDNIVPSLLSTHSDGQNVIERQIL